MVADGDLLVRSDGVLYGIYCGAIDGIICGMDVTIDAVGRLVIPKEIRERAGLSVGATLTVRLENGSVVLEPAPLQAHLEQRGVIRVIVPDQPIDSLTVETTRLVLEEIRER